LSNIKIIASSTCKNPLGQVFGMVLRKTRDILVKGSSEIAVSMGIGESYYRVVESGGNALHVNKSMALTDAFEGKFHFDAVVKIISAITICEASARKAIDDGGHYADGIIHASDKLAIYDEAKLAYILKTFDEHQIFKKIKTKDFNEIARLIRKHGIDELVFSFLTDYKNFGKYASDKQNDELIDFLKEVPTIYFEFLNDIKKSLLSLPIKIGFEALWEWEDRNMGFESIIAVIQKHDLVTNQDNLNRYCYHYLNEGCLKKITFFYMDNNKDPYKVKEIFKRNLLISLQNKTKKTDNRKGINDVLSNYESCMEKIKFIQISSKDFSFEESSSTDTEGGAKEYYNAVWLYCFPDHTVGFSAYINPENAKYSTGRSLKHKEASIYLKKMESLYQENE